MIYCWLKCLNVKSGMFSDEIVCFFRDGNGTTRAIFVAKKDVDVKNKRLRVEKIGGSSHVQYHDDGRKITASVMEEDLVFDDEKQEECE